MAATPAAAAVPPVPAIIATGAIPRYLKRIPEVGIPDKVDRSYLKGLGFNNSNDGALVPLFKALGFLDHPGGKPTDRYRSYRAASGDNAKRVLGGAVKNLYAGLFQTFPDAHRKDDEALTNWIRANTDGGADVQRRALNTFKTLASAATFDDDTAAPAAAVDLPPVVDMPAVNGSGSGNGNAAPAVNGSGQVQHVRSQTTPEVTLNVTLQIAATNDPSIYDQFFASMKKHLFPDAT